MGLGVGIPLAILFIFGVCYAVYHFKFKNKKNPSPTHSKIGEKTIDVKDETNQDNIVYYNNENVVNNQVIEKKVISNNISNIKND